MFDEEIMIDLQRVAVREVNNFQDSDPEAINICFSNCCAGFVVNNYSVILLVIDKNSAKSVVSRKTI